MQNSSFKGFIPNLLTLANLGCGTLAIVAIFSGDYVLAAWLVGGSLLLDFFDGFAARLLHVSGELGKQLDSLADVVSFGVVPGFLFYKVLEEAHPQNTYLPFVALLIPLFSAYRLAKFNIDTRQAEHFIGMPTPANAISLFAIALTALHTESEAVSAFLLNPIFLVVLILLSSYLLIAELPLMSLKLKTLKWHENKGRIILVLGTLTLFIIFRFMAFAFIIPLYLLLSLIFKPDTE